MNVNILFQFFQLALILIILVFLVRYLWGTYFDNDYQPVTWRQKIKEGAIPRELIKLERKYPDKVRFFNIWFQIERLKKEKISGSFAELGVYKGETARIIHLTAPSRTLHLFDTFEGLPSRDLIKESGEAATYTSKNFADTTIQKIISLFKNDANVKVHPGYFPDTTAGLEDETYAFVNIDADLYNPIKEGLNYFYPRLAPGGCIIIHDYNYKWEGAMKAVDEFVKGIPESLVAIPDMQSSVMIIKSKYLE
ncbi:MAG: class I SAM-dependent methyltransferase [Bacteroidales bacterium]|nr:class I SAM-dependent methyltransferase [Bacteroidales bacterium]